MNRLTPTIRVQAGYGCWPTWFDAHEEFYNIDPGDPSLGLSGSLYTRLSRWAAQMDATLNLADGSESGFAEAAQFEKFVAEGRELARLVGREVGSSFRVEYKPPGGRPFELISEPT